MNYGDPKAVQKLFNTAAPTYDLLNDILSLGLHRLWKRRLVSLLAPVAGETWLDLCCGTGDLAFVLARVLGPSGSVMAIDSARETLELAHQRSSKNGLNSLSWMNADVLDTGLPSNSFDGAVMAYGLRNVASPEAALHELLRLLKPGAKAGLLDFNKFGNDSLGAKFQKFYLRRIVVPVASLVGLRDQYVYLEGSLARFLTGLEQEDLALKVGFTDAQYSVLASGQMGILLLRS